MTRTRSTLPESDTTVGHEQTDYFDYPLPPEQIAQEPAEPRDSARLLIDRPDGIHHGVITDLVAQLGPGDVVVINDTKVIPARLNLVKSTGGRVEVLLLEPTGLGRQWKALVRGGRRVKPGTMLFDPANTDSGPLVYVLDVLEDGIRHVELTDDAESIMDQSGRLPLPPYITTEPADENRYQTVFARTPGSVAAPTAGLHLTDELLKNIADVGVRVVRIDLRVGLGTFRPISVDRVVDHHMHSEHYRISNDDWETVVSAKRVVAVGTTVVRTLESAASTGNLSGTTDLFINRGFQWQIVDALLTNFHVPRSSLLVLVDAFVGERWREIYQSALEERYRFLSFGDAMLLRRTSP